MENQTPLDLPAPEDPIARIHALAYDLAYGAVNGKWPLLFDITHNQFAYTYDISDDLNSYLMNKWRFSYPDTEFLVVLGYLRKISDKTTTLKTVGSQIHVECYRITEKALLLLEKAPPTSIFISYNRQQSSPFALLVLNVLKKEGLEAFLDIKSIAPGDDWHGVIENEVKKRENFIVLLNRTALKSKYVRQEIRWAIEGNPAKYIIPIFHGGLKPKNFKDDEFQELLTKNAIIVEQETAIAYESALLQLLNYFGRTL